MTGEDVKIKLLKAGYKITQIADAIKMSQPHLSGALTVKDVKTGFIEKLCDGLNLTVGFFYEDTPYYNKRTLISVNKDKKTDGVDSQTISSLINMISQKDEDMKQLREDLYNKIEKKEAIIEDLRTKYDQQLSEKEAKIENLNQQLLELRRESSLQKDVTNHPKAAGQ